MQTLAGIRARVLHRTHQTLAQISLTNSSSDGQTILNDMIFERASLIQGVASFSWAQNIWVMNSSPAVIGQNDPTAYPLPLDFKHELSVVDVLQPAPLIPMEWTNYKYLEPTVRSVDVPAYYTYPPGGRTISFYPDLGSGRTINITYARMPFVLYDDLSKPNVPERISAVYFKCLLEGCAEDVFRGMLNHVQEAEVASVRYEKALRDLKLASRMHGLIVEVLSPSSQSLSYSGPTLPSTYPYSP